MIPDQALAGLATLENIARTREGGNVINVQKEAC